jgi:hypothetical protein
MTQLMPVKSKAELAERLIAELRRYSFDDERGVEVVAMFRATKTIRRLIREHEGKRK